MHPYRTLRRYHERCRMSYWAGYGDGVGTALIFCGILMLLTAALGRLHG